ncbi:MAG: hypothetical protein GY938_12940 [Ketobacter sp.]|nr:hypothetical protein [Ketobacter sp.]
MGIFEAGRQLLEAASDAEMPEVALIERLGDGDGVYGSGGTGYSSVGVDIPCRVGRDESTQMDNLDVNSQLTSVVDSLLSFPVGTDVNAKDRVTLDSGRVFEVKGDSAKITTLAMVSVVASEVT